MTLVYIEAIKDHLDRDWLVFHAPSSTTEGKVYKVKNLKHTDIWSCPCPAFATYKNPCRHVPNGVEPPRASEASTSSHGAEPPHPSPPVSSDLSGEDFRSDIADKLITVEAAIEDFAARDSYFRRLCIEAKSGPFIIYLLMEFRGLRIVIPEGHSLESYLMSLWQFSTIRTAVYEVRRRHAADVLWQPADPNLGEQQRDGYAWAAIATRDPGSKAAQSTFQAST